MRLVNNKILYLIVVPSAIALFLALADSSFFSVVFALIIGLSMGIGVYFAFMHMGEKISEKQLLIDIIIGSLICLKVSNMFYQTWSPLSNPLQFAMKGIVLKVSCDYLLGIRIIGIILGVVAWPASVLFVGCLNYFCVRCLKEIDLKKVWTELVKNFSITSMLKCVGIIIVNLAIAVVVGTVLLMGVYAFPTDSLKYNVRQSAYTIEEEGTYPQLFKWATSQLDNSTDSLMLMESASDFGISPIQDAMNVPRGAIIGNNPAETLVGYYIKGIQCDKVINYPRYWHGYLILLKLLLRVMDYKTMRRFNGIVQVLFVILICLLLIKKGHKLAIPSYIASYFMLMPMALAKSLQFSSCFYIFTFGCLLLLLLNDDKRKQYSMIVFLYCGIMTAFFDFLTYPIATFGVPMIFYLLLLGSETTEHKLIEIIKSGFFWCVGFVGMWVSKWLLGSFVTGENIVANGLGAVADRTSNSSSDGTATYSVFACEIKNYMTFLKTPVTVIVILLMGYLICKCVKLPKRSMDSFVRSLAPFFLVGLVPIVWYAFATNHSIIHFWFTNKSCVITVLAVLFGLTSLLQSNCINNIGTQA